MVEYKIGTTLGGMTLLSSLATPVPWPRATFSMGERTTVASGAARDLGWMSAEWLFPLLTDAQRDQLRTFCTGASATVYIRTQDVDAVYRNYQAVLVWPDDEERRGGLVFDLRLRFRALVLQA